jgi:DNA-binding response OmpR family regulator
VASYNKGVKPTIFLMEDDADIARLVRHHLDSAGFAVRSYASASGVLPDAEKEAPSLFLLDIMVPGATASTSAAESARTPRSLLCQSSFLRQNRARPTA